MCVNNLSKVALDSAAAGIEPPISSRKSNALTTAPTRILTTTVQTYLLTYLFTCLLSNSHTQRALPFNGRHPRTPYNYSFTDPGGMEG